ncbi:MAG: FlgD immunoglobulin-like domain containing protein, partial [Candidatus Zixiibacteriota bacterium]
VLQDVETGDPMMLTRYINSSGTYSYDCVHMQAELQHSTEFAGSFYADDIRYGGSAEFFSSVTLTVSPPPMTGVDKVTYLHTGTFDIATVKCDLGTHGVFQDGCVDLTIQQGAIDCSGPEARYVWVGPTYMEWAPVTQPDILPIGDADGYATYVSFTDCYYCCGWLSPYFGDEGGGIQAAGAGATNGDCCFNPNKYAKIKMCYDPEVDTDKEHLAVAWWDCDAGEYCFDNIYYPAGVEGFNVEEHTVEFATTCLNGPFVVVQLLERECDGTIVVNTPEVGPYCDGYTSPTPRFTSLITDNIQGTDGIDENSIMFKIDGSYVYDGSKDGCDAWAKGFGNYPHSGWDDVSGLFVVGWSQNSSEYSCYYDRDGYDDEYHRIPADPLTAGEHTATVTAMNYNIQSCTKTYDFTVDATEPMVRFADAGGAYVGENPNFCIYFTDTESGVDKNSIYIDIYGDETSSPDPNNHTHIGTLEPAQLNWVNDTTVCVDATFEYYGGYLHIYVYGGPECECRDCSSPQYYQYDCGVADCVGNHTDVFWQYYSVDAEGPSVTMDCESSNGGPIKITIHDAQSGVDWSSLEFYEDGILLCEGLGCIDEESISLDTDRGILVYTPDADGASVEIRISDNLGNLTVESCDVPVAEEDVLTLDPHNYPNPFDPTRGDGLTYIVPGLSKTCHLTVKIYDFAGEFVTELQNAKETSTSEKIKWDGTTDGGTEVANGTYLCYLYANCDGSTKTAVIKITVLKEDK